MLSKTGWILVLCLNMTLASAGGVGSRLPAAVGGAVVGAFAGLGATIGIVVVRARVENHYIESTRDLMDPRLLIAPALSVVGGATGWAGRTMLTGFAGGALVGAGVGGAAGALIGSTISPRAMDRWAGGAIGGAVGMILGIAVGLVLAARRRDRRERHSGPAAGPAGPISRSFLLSLLIPAVAACSEPIPELPDVEPAPEGEEVESVVFLVGDPGKARYQYYPVLPRLANDVEEWSARLEADSSVVVVMLGDVVYPDGMNDAGTPAFPTDSARVMSQIRVVGGPEAQAAGARMYFVAGNHDWGLREDRVGTRRLRNLDDFIERARGDGPWVDLVPEAGAGGPHITDVGSYLRLVLLDTAWWLFDAEPAAKRRVVGEIESAIATAGQRAVVVAAHHPFETAGPHGGFRPIWQTLGVRDLLARSGALLQDLESEPYVQLLDALEEAFVRTGRPLVFAGGHEHSLQVIHHDSVANPRYSLVSGSASKLSGVGYVDGMLFRRSAPGYMRLLVRQNGAVDVFVEAAPDAYLLCDQEEPEAVQSCMDEGVAAYQTVFSMRLRPAAAGGPPQSGG